MSDLAQSELEMAAEDIGAVTEALIELLRHTLAARFGPSPRFARLAALHANRRGKKASIVVDLVPSPDAVLDLAAETLSDIEVYIRTAPQ